MTASVGLAVALSLLPLSRGYAQLLGVSCLIGAFIGVIYPQTLGFITKWSPTANLGFAVGLYETIFGIGFAAGPIIAGFMLQATNALTACLALAIVALSIVPMLFLQKPVEPVAGDDLCQF